MPFLITHVQLYWKTKKKAYKIQPKDKADITCENIDISDTKIYRI